MQNNLSIERSKQEQSAQTTKIKPKWHMTVLHVVYYLIMIAFLVFYMLPFWGTVMTSFKSNSEVMTTTPITPPSEWTMEGYESAMEELAQPLMTSLLALRCGGIGIPRLDLCLRTEQMEVPVQQRVLYRAGRGNILALPGDSDSAFADHQRP